MSRDDPPQLGGAERLADPSGGRVLFGFDWGAGDWSLEDVSMASASDLAAGDGRLYLLFDGLGAEESVIAASRDGRSEGFGMARVAGRFSTPGRSSVTAVGFGPRGEVAAVFGSEAHVYGFRWVDLGYNTALQSLTARFEVGAAAFVHRNEVLLGSASEGVIDVASLELGSGEVTQRRLLGGPDDVEAAVRSEESLGPIAAITVLTDGRVAFVADGEDGYQLYVISGDQVREVDTGGVNPVRAEAVDMSELARRDRWPMAPLSASPDGRILAVGLDGDGEPQITLVSPDSGDVEVLADLDGVEPTVEQRISAAIVGNDLFFLAEGSLWKKAGVLPR